MVNVKYNNINVDIKNSQMKLPDGSVLAEDICSDVCLAYERLCTARYLMDSYNIKTYKRAWELADEVREQMADYGLTEDEAIDEVLHP